MAINFLFHVESGLQTNRWRGSELLGAAAHAQVDLGTPRRVWRPDLVLLFVPVLPDGLLHAQVLGGGIVGGRRGRFRQVLGAAHLARPPPGSGLFPSRDRGLALGPGEKGLGERQPGHVGQLHRGFVVGGAG